MRKCGAGDRMLIWKRETRGYTDMSPENFFTYEEVKRRGVSDDLEAVRGGTLADVPETSESESLEGLETTAVVIGGSLTPDEGPIEESRAGHGRPGPMSIPRTGTPGIGDYAAKGH